MATIVTFSRRESPAPASIDSQTSLSHASELERQGNSLFNAGNVAAAREQFIRATRLLPREPRLQFAVAICELYLGNETDAATHLQNAIRLNPRYGQAHAWLGEWYLRQGMIDAALASTATAMEIDPADLGHIQSRAWVLEAAGEMDDAWALVQQLLARGQKTPSVARLYGRLSPRYGQGAAALELIDTILARGVTPDNANLHFTAADLLERAGRFDDAFEQAVRGNAARRRPAYVPAAQADFVQRLERYFTREKLTGLPASSSTSELPVFVVGMPRSGTSLLEQILASHAAVRGAGELDFIHHIFTGLNAMLASNMDEYPRCLERVTADQLDGMADIYLQPLRALAPGAQRIIDKMPINFMHLGLIQMLLPNARVIHCRRDPIDTCLSCFMTDFNVGNQFKYDLVHLGHFYRLYERLMEHWRSVLTLPILDVTYEELVAEPEAQSRRMIEFLNLPWDANCLRFHETRRPVTTASVQQVRKPIYKSSIQRWRRYAKHLNPLLKTLYP